jgi:hypothetical protein
MSTAHAGGPEAARAVDIPPGGRVPWQGGSWYLHGANVPWLNWARDFGGGAANGGVSSAASRADLERGFAQLRDAGVRNARWWTFEGDAWQIRRDAAGAPTALDPAVYADFDAALALAETYDLSYTFVLFSGPSHLPPSWLNDPSHRAKLADALAPLFARYASNPRVLSWEVFNEPDFDVWAGRVPEASLRETVRAVAQAVHAHSPAYVTVGMGFADGLPMVVGTGLDYYQAHWYDYMASGDYCLRCRDYASVRDQYNLDGPLVIGELYLGPDVDALARLDDFYANGYAGAWPWSLFPERTQDRMPIDWAAMRTFGGRHADLGPRTGAAPPPVTTPPTPLRFATSAALDRTRVGAGETLTATATVTATAGASALIDLEVYGPTGRVAAEVFDTQAFAAGQPRTFTLRLPVTAETVPGDHVLKIGVFAPGWGRLYEWNDNAGTFVVATAAAPPPPPRFSARATAAPSTVEPGGSVTISASIASATAMRALVDVEVYGPTGQRVFARALDDQAFAAGQERTFTLTWDVAADVPAGRYVVKVGAFKVGWGQLYAWEDAAAVVTVAAPPPPVACAPRPPVRVTTAPRGPGLLEVTVAATGANNTLREVRFGQPSNALVDVPNGPAASRAAFAHAPRDASPTLTFTVRRAAAGATTVPIVVADRCGEWPTLVGGGADAF